VKSRSGTAIVVLPAVYTGAPARGHRPLRPRPSQSSRLSSASFGILAHGCPWSHTDLTDRIRAHLYDCALLPAAVRSRAQAAREAAQGLLKRNHQLRDAAGRLLREAEAALYALRATMRQATISSATREQGRPSGGAPQRGKTPTVGLRSDTTGSVRLLGRDGVAVRRRLDPWPGVMC
jgi:hypothetical protein